jgi:hypothetical protein
VYTVPLPPDDFLDVTLYNEGNSGTYVKGLNAKMTAGLSKEQIFIKRKKILRAQYPPTLKLLQGMEYNQKMNLVTNLHGLPLELNQNVAQEVKKPKKQRPTTINERKETKVGNNIYYPNLPACTGGYRVKRKRQSALYLTVASKKTEKPDEKIL